MIALVVLLGLSAFAVAYRTYARYLGRLFELSPDRDTPAHVQQDGRDFYPARTPVLVGHHFSSIAGAGPIVGPVFATLVFGWLPSVIWIVLGSIFIGGVHDLGSLAVSIRHRAQSIAQVAAEYMNPLAVKLLLIFVWLTLVYVLVVFLDLTATTFAPRVPEGLSPADATALTRRGGGVASSSLMFIGLALLFGGAVYRLKLSLARASAIFVPLVFLGIYAGQLLPILPAWLPAIEGSPTKTWSLVLLAYCLVASVTPVWILLQPRDYLSSFLLYACLVGGLVGVLLSPLVGGELTLQFPAFLGFRSERLGFLFPALFITIACGACSGFHSIVASGTTAKQLDREPDARLVGYGSMLLEGVLALISVSTVAILAQGSPETRLAPPALFASGLGRFLGLLGIPPQLGESFGLLALSTFLLTTLDTCTRLGRYVLEELLGMRRGRGTVWISSLATLALPLLFNLMTFHDVEGQVIPVWKLIWPVFGSTNQLLGGLALMVITLWLKRTGRPSWVTLWPMIFMVTATTVALAQLALHHGLSLVGGIAAALLLLALVLLFAATRALLAPVPDTSSG